MASAAAVGSLRLPLLSSPCCYLSSSSSSCTPLCTRSTPAHAPEHQFHRHRRLCLSPPPNAVSEVLRYPTFSFPERDRISSRDACCPGEAATKFAQRLELGSPPAGAPPEPPSSSNSITAAFPSPVSSSNASSRGEQSLPARFSLPCML
jgi:hypothetical protein